MALLLAACAQEPRDPRQIMREAVRRPPEAAAAEVFEGPMPLVAAAGVVQDYAESAPMGETSQRQVVVHRQLAVLAIGHGAREVFAEDFVRLVEAQNPELDLRLEPTSDRGAIERVQAGKAELAILGGVLSARDLHAGLRQTRVAIELYGLVVGSCVELRSLQRPCVRQILSGGLTEWRQNAGGTSSITVAVERDRAFAERTARAFMAGDGFAASAQRTAGDADTLAWVAEHPGAVGVVRLAACEGRSDVRVVPIDEIPPTVQSYRGGRYGYGQLVHLVTNGEPRAASQQVLATLGTPAGRALLAGRMYPPE